MSENSKKTTYQGTERMFGEFKCPKCGRLWMSANSWANCGQQCSGCKSNVYPYKQTSLTKYNRKNTIDSTKDHLEELCEKCKLLGYSCAE